MNSFQSAASSPNPASSPTLDSLPTSGVRLAELFRRGRLPPPLEGRIDGRLIPPGVPRVLVDVVPWLGKTLHPTHGANRLRWLGERFPFDVRPGVSRGDDGPCLIFDYDRPDNPPGIRRIFDELREIAPGLYLGPGRIRLRGRTPVWTWFALQP